MLTRYRDPEPAHISRRMIRGMRTACLAFVVVSLAACGGGGGGGDSKPPTVGTVTVKVTDSAGAPISGAGVSLSAVASSSDPMTDANGEVTIQDAVAGARSVSARKGGYFFAVKDFTLAADSVTKVTLNLARVTEATPVVLATHPSVSSDGRTLTVDVDIAVLGADGSALETLTGSEFGVIGASDCLSGNCVYDSQWRSFIYNARVDRGTFGFVSARSRPAIAAAVLLEQSTEMASLDPTGERREAVSIFFEAITPPDLVTLGSYQRVTGKPVLTTYGGFTSDTSSLRTALSALTGQEQGSNPRPRAVAEMVAFVKANSPDGPADLRRAVVLVTQGQPKDQSDNEFFALPDNTVAVVTISSGWLWPNAGEYVATGGAYVLAEYPEQLPVVFRGIGAIVGRSLAYNRVRIVLDAPQAGAFVSGNYLTALMSYRVSPQSVIGSIPVPIRL